MLIDFIIILIISYRLCQGRSYGRQRRCCLPKRGYFAVSRSSVGVRFDNLSNIPEEA